MSRIYVWIGVPLVALGALAFTANSTWARGGGGGGGGGFSGGGRGGSGFSGGSSFSGGHSFSAGPSIGSSGRSFSPSVGASNFSSHSFSPGNMSSGVHNFSMSHQFGSSSFHPGGENFNHNVNTFNNAQNWSHNENWNHGNWGWHDHDHFHDNFFIGFGGPFWWPGWWWGGYGYPDYGYGYGYDDSYPYSVGYASDPQNVTAAATEPEQPAADEGASNAGAEFFAQSVAAFNGGQYKDALKMANHAAVEAPQNPKAHEVMSLSMFALGEYHPAAMEAHAALALGPPADWNELYSYYGDESKYTSQLRDLEKYSKDNPTSADAHFLRAYQYLMMGHTDAFKEQMQQVTKLAPKDKLAAELLTKYGGGAATNPPLPPPPTPPGASIPARPGAGNVSLGGVDS